MLPGTENSDNFLDFFRKNAKNIVFYVAVNSDHRKHYDCANILKLPRLVTCVLSIVCKVYLIKDHSRSLPRLLSFLNGDN